MKSFIALIIAFGMVTPSFAAAQDYGFLGFGGGGDSFLFGNRPSAPRQELYVHSWGLTDPAPNYLQQQNQYTTSYYQPQNSGYGYNSYGAQFANPYFSQYGNQYLGSNGYQNVMPQFVNYIAAPNTMSVPGMNTSYGTPSYQNYSYPSYQQYSYSEPQYTSYGSYGYGAAPTGGKDFWGNPMCNWGADYGNFPCDRDPHQWVYDPYSGSWY